MTMEITLAMMADTGEEKILNAQEIYNHFSQNEILRVSTSPCSQAINAKMELSMCTESGKQDIPGFQLSLLSSMNLPLWLNI